MKVLFYYRGRESLAVEYLSAVLKKSGHEVDLIFDPGLDNTNYYKNDLLKICKNEDLLIERARKFSPHLVAFSATTNEYPYVVEMSGKLKKILNVPFLVGGIHPTVAPEYVLDNPNIDIICRGEGEFALLKLVELMSSDKDFYHVQNMWFKKRKGEIIRNELMPLTDDLDIFLFRIKNYFFNMAAAGMRYLLSVAGGVFLIVIIVSSIIGVIFIKVRGGISAGGACKI